MKKKMFKRATAFLTASLMAVGVVFTVPDDYWHFVGAEANAESEIIDGSYQIDYDLSLVSEIATLSDFDYNDDNVTSSELAERSQLGENIFYSFENGTLTIRGSGEMFHYEFANWSPLHNSSGIYSVVIENGVTNISNSTFEGTYNLRNIIIPDSVTKIGKNAFFGCISLNNVVLPDSVTYIGESVFQSCTSLKNITLSKNITEIPNNAFYNCKSLNQIILPSGINKIGNGAFMLCSSLTDINIPTNVTVIENEMFYGCSSLKTLDLPLGIKRIGEAAFIYCGSLTKVSLPDTVESIDGWAFDSCTNLKEINIPKSVTSIGTSAFRLCENLEKIIIPANVTSIGEYAFIGDDNLTIYGYSNTVAETYAKENNIPFVSLDGEISDTPTLDPDKYLSYACTAGKTEFTYDIPNKKFKPDSSTLSCSLFYNQLPTTVTEPEYFLTINKIEITAPQGFSFGENGSPKYLERLDSAELYTVTSGDKKSSYDFQIPLYPISYTENGSFEIIIKVYGDNDFVKVFKQEINIKRTSASPENAIDVSEEYDETDTDGDGLPDVWEMYGITYNGEFLDLPAMGANPNVPDVFVEVDYQEDYDLSELDPYFEMVYNQFKKHNINLHIDAGMNSKDYVTGNNWGNNTGSNPIPGTVKISKQTDLGVITHSEKNKWKRLINYNFNDNQVRALIFRHCIFGDEITDTSNNDGVTVGLSAGIPSQYLFVAYGQFGKTTGYSERDEISKERNKYDAVLTFMHELGHNLGLHHGGIDANGKGDDTNFKPNYVSIMNYSYSNGGLYVSYHETKYDDEGVYYDDVSVHNYILESLNYSDVYISALDEKKLNENKIFEIKNNTIKEGHDIRTIVWHYLIGKNEENKNVYKKQLSIFDDPIDFNRDHDYSDNVSCDINKDDKKTTLKGTTNDWEHIIFKTGIIGSNAAALTAYQNTFMTDEFDFQITDEEPMPSHIHSYSNKWMTNSISHWHQCDCGEEIDIANHVSDSGQTTIQPTSTLNGVRTYSCSVCGYIIRTETIPATGNNNSSLNKEPCKCQ